MTTQAVVLDFDDPTWHWNESPAKVRSGSSRRYISCHFQATGSTKIHPYWFYCLKWGCNNLFCQVSKRGLSSLHLCQWIDFTSVKFVYPFDYWLLLCMDLNMKPYTGTLVHWRISISNLSYESLSLQTKCQYKGTASKCIPVSYIILEMIMRS